MQKTGPLKTVVLPVLLLLLLLGLAGRFWVSELEYSFTGPTHITAGSTGVFAFMVLLLLIIKFLLDR